MDIKPGKNVNRDRFNAPKDSLEVMYGLPKDVIFCSRCNISNQQPMSTNEYENTKDSLKVTMELDSENICRACKTHEFKRNGEINWDERERELRDLCDHYRKDDGTYDCIVGGSGGKGGSRLVVVILEATI